MGHAEGVALIPVLSDAIQSITSTIFLKKIVAFSVLSNKKTPADGLQAEVEAAAQQEQSGDGEMVGYRVSCASAG